MAEERESINVTGNVTIEPTWKKLFAFSTNKYSGYVASVEEAMALVKEYELKTTTRFSCFKADKMFGSGGKITSKK